MRHQQGILPLARMGAIARPRIVSGTSHHPGSHRIELDVAAACQEVRSRVHQARLVAPFPQRARATVAAIEQPGIVACKGMHQPRQRPCLTRCQQQVHMVAHQHIGVQPATEPPQRLPQALQVALTVKIIHKTRQPVVAPLHHVLRNTGKIKTRLASHAHSIAALPARRCQPKPCPHIIPIPHPPTGIVPDTFFAISVSFRAPTTVGNCP